MSTRSARYTSQKLHIPKGRLASGSDRDAGAFLEAATIYDSRQQRAIYELVRLLKQYGIWSKMKAIYPFVGGTATTHKWNLKDPQDTDAAFRLTFNGGWTHSSTGALPNGSNGYADTFLKPATSLSLNSTHGSVYSRTNTNTLAPLLSGQDFAGSGLFNIWPRYSASNDIYMRVNSVPTATLGTTTSSSAYYIGNRNASSGTANFRNTTKYAQTQTSGTIDNNSVYLSRQSSAYSDREIAFATIGDGLTDTEAANLYYAVQRYQQILGRAV